MLNGSSNQVLNELVSRMRERHYDRGQILYMPGDPGDAVFLMKAGRVQQYHLSLGGRKLVTAILKPGDIFGATAVINGYHRHVFAEALDDCVIHALDRCQAKELLLREPKATLLLISKLARRLSRAEEKLEELVFEPIPVRLARCLIETSENGIVEDYSHQDLAEMLRAYRETVTVTLNHFKNQGLIDIERRRIAIRDLAGLNCVATRGDMSQHGTRTRDRAVHVASHPIRQSEIRRTR